MGMGGMILLCFLLPPTSPGGNGGYPTASADAPILREVLTSALGSNRRLSDPSIDPTMLGRVSMRFP